MLCGSFTELAELNYLWIHTLYITSIGKKILFSSTHSPWNFSGQSFQACTNKISNVLKLDELNFLVFKWYTLLPYMYNNIFHLFLVFPVLKFRKFPSTKIVKSLMGKVTPDG